MVSDYACPAIRRQLPDNSTGRECRWGSAFAGSELGCDPANAGKCRYSLPWGSPVTRRRAWGQTGAGNQAL